MLRERIAFGVFIVLSVVTYVAHIVRGWLHLRMPDSILFVDYIVPITLMIIIFTCLMYQLWFYHRFEFKKNVLAMTFFFFTEVTFIIILVLGELEVGVSK